MLPDAAVLLSLRHRRQRAARPELPVDFEGAIAARAAVEAVWRREGASGVAALSGARLQGYMVGEMVLDNLWGRSGWMRFAGCALAPDQDPELVRDLYAALASKWVQFGCYNHFALMPPSDEGLVGRWFALAFGIEQVYALAALEELDLTPRPLPPEIEIRRAGPDDRAHLEALSDIIWRHQVQAPVWGIHLPELEARQRVQYGDLADDPEATLWLALSQGEAVGLHGYFPAPTRADDLLTPDQCIELGVGGTRAEARGRGIGQALTRHGLAHARAAGYRFCLTDWRSTNLLSSRFWPHQGFRPVAYRLSRRVDPRIAWAGER
jgi:ribosomal protein S18 acetylase RimI-like enzyme